MAKKGQTHYSLEDKARALAEFRLRGSYRRAARSVGCDHKQVERWKSASDKAPHVAPWKKVLERKEQLLESRKATLDRAFNIALELQVRDLDDAHFRDRTGFLKIIGEQKRLAHGKPTSIVGKPDEIDKEIDRLVAEYVEKEREREEKRRAREAVEWRGR